MLWSDSSRVVKGEKWNVQKNRPSKENLTVTNGTYNSYDITGKQAQQTGSLPTLSPATKRNQSTELDSPRSAQSILGNEQNSSAASVMNPHDIWQRVLGELETQLPPSTFNTWVRDTRVYAYEDGEFIICAANAYACDWLQNRLRSMIKRSLTALVGRQVQVQFRVCAKPIDDLNPTAATPLYDSPMHESSVDMSTSDATQSTLSQSTLSQSTLSQLAVGQIVTSQLQHEKVERSVPVPLLLPNISLGRQAFIQTGLNSSYTFDTFIVGKHNQLASAAALSIVDKPGGSFNPLFVYGGVGLGKTHLLHAVGNQLYQRGYRTLYCTSEQFTNDLISAIRSQSTDEFRNKYRELDLLLIDDIQFIGGKDSTQEEFFHTFNHLFNSGKQVVISSDKVPRSVPTLENRLRSRFEGGLQVDVSMPDFETRVAILESKARERSLNVGLEVLKEIAGRVESNVRELEGALNQVALQAELLNNRPDIGLARKILDSLSPHKTPCAPARVIECVALHYKFASSDITGARRTKDLAQARHVVMFLLRTLNGLSLPVIGHHLGDRDHTTVSHGIERIEKQMVNDDTLRRDLLVLRDKVFSTYH